MEAQAGKAACALKKEAAGEFPATFFYYFPL